MEKKGDVKGALLVIFILISLLFGGFIAYDKLVKKDDTLKCPECDCSNFGENVFELKRIEINDTIQRVKFGDTELAMKRGYDDDGDFGFLYINDNLIHEYNGIDSVYADYAYITDKYILFTVVAQAGEVFCYAVDNDLNSVVVNNNNYQIQSFEIKDNYLHASGHVFCGEDDCPNADLIVKYIDKTLIAVKY